MEEPNILVNVFIYLLAAIIAVPLFKRLGLGSVLGYLIAGVAIGPWGLRLIHEVEHILHFAEFGVVLLLFLIGLELNPQRLWAMRKSILGLGGGQVLATSLVLMLAGMLMGIEWRYALVAAMGLALSSTAIALQLLTEKNLMPTSAGKGGFSILLFQDIAVIPMLAVLPLLADNTQQTASSEEWLGFVYVIGVIAIIVIGGRYLLRPIFRLIAATQVREIFTAFSLLLVIGTALLMQAVDMSMALGTFLAGVLLAESEYRHALESDIEPFKGLLLGLFFIAVGMSVDFGLLLQKPLLVVALVVGLISVKITILWILALKFNISKYQQAFFAFLLSQGGEFAFVLFSVATASGALSADISALLIGVVALSMMTTPLLLIINQKFIEPRFASNNTRPMDEVDDEQNPVIIAGFGRFGQIVGRLLHANGIETTILDHDPNHVDMTRKFGFKVFYGDAARIDLLEAAGAKKAKLLVLAIDDKEQALDTVDLVKEHFPNLTIVTRAWDLAHAFELLDRGVNDIQRETFESALKTGEQTLHHLGFSAWQAKQASNQFRNHDEKLLMKLFKHYQDDLKTRIAISTSERDSLREQMQGDDAFYGQKSDKDWQ